MITLVLSIALGCYEVVARTLKPGKKGRKIISLVGVVLDVAKVVSDKLRVK